MGLIDRLRALTTPVPIERAAWPPRHPLADNMLPFVNLNGNMYPIQGSLAGADETVGTSFFELVWGALYANPAVYALEQARVNLFKQARPMWRQLRSGTPGDLFSSEKLDILRTPWPGGTTADLLSAMALSGDIGGVAFVVRLPGRLAVLRPDWTYVAYGSASHTGYEAEAEMLGVVYYPGGPGSGLEPVVYLRQQLAIFVPMRDPLDPTRGMSWMRPAVREISADNAATSHKLLFFKNGATPSTVVTGVPGATPQAFADWVAKFSASHDGVRNAYKTMYLSGAVDVKVVGSDLQQMTFKEMTGAGQTILAAAAGVPPVVVGFSEGLAGSSLNSGNFAASMRRFADLTGRPWWADAFASLATIVPPPAGAELFYDDRYIPALKDDIKDAAEVQALHAQAIRSLVDAGFEPASVVDAVNAGDLRRLSHTGLFSVQLQPPGTEEPDPETEPETPAADAAEDEAEKADPQPARDLVFEALSVMRAEATRERPAPIHNMYLTLPEARNEINVSPTPVTVESPAVTVNVEPTPLEVRNEVSVEPTPVQITNEAPVVNVPEQRTVTKTVVREGGQITRIIEEPTDG